MPTKRLNLNLPEHAYEELRSLANGSGRSMTDVVRSALSLASLARSEAEKENFLAVTNREGTVLKQVIFPL